MMCNWSRDTPGPISRRLRAENTELWLTSRVDLWSKKNKKKKTIQNNNIKQIRNKKLITEIWTETFLLLQLKYHFLKSGQTRLCHNKKIINIILIINILQNQNQQCNKKVFYPSLGRRARETAKGGAWRQGKRKKVTSKNKKGRKDREGIQRTSSLQQTREEEGLLRII